MSVVDFIKEKNEKFQKNQNELMSKIEPQLRDFSEICIQKINNTKNSTKLFKNSAWFIKLSQMYEGESTFDIETMSPSAHALYEKVHGQIGEVIGVGDWFEVDQERINQFAEVTEDKQWIHVDLERAKKESPFRATVSHGLLTLALIPRLTGLVDIYTNLHPEARMVVNCGLNQVRFPSPAKSGSLIRATTIVKKVSPQKKSIEVVNEIQVEVKGGIHLVCIAEVVLRIYA